MFSQSRQINGCKNIVGEWVVGTSGKSNCADMIMPAGGDAWRYREKMRSAYEQEHQNLMASILAGKPINEAQNIAESTMTAIIGREAAYSGQEVTWDEALESPLDLTPPAYAFGDLPVPPVAMPGRRA